MARSYDTDDATRRRILANAQERRAARRAGRSAAPPAAAAAAPADGGAERDRRDPERILSRPIGPVSRASRLSRGHLAWWRTVLRVLLFGVIVIGGIAAIIWLRNLAASFGVVWIGDR